MRRRAHLRPKVLLDPRARAWRSWMLKSSKRDWDPALYERYAALARAALLRAYEECLAQSLAVAGVETLEQWPIDHCVMAQAALVLELTRVVRNFNAIVKGWPRGGVKADDPVGACDWHRRVEELAGRVEELAGLYRLGEMGQP